MTKANEALNKMAENARELGLDYEPAQQEPVAWLDDDGNLHREKPPYKYGPDPRPLVFGYTPPPQRTWVGLTLEDKQRVLANDCGGNRLDCMDAADRILKDKNT